MANEYQPLDLNLRPMGVLRPGQLYSIDDIASATLPDAGVYRLFSSGDAAITCTYPGETVTSTLHFTNGTIEYFYFPAGTTIANTVDSTSVYLVKMQ